MEIPKTPPLTIGLVAVCVGIFILINLGLRDTLLPPLLISEYIRPTLPEIIDGEIWRLLTPIFLHFGIFHIAFNMLWTWELGRIIEWRQGMLFLGVLTLVTGIVGNLVQYYFSGPLFGGMSGVIYGLFGYVWIQGMTNPQFGIRLNPVIVKVMLGWFLVCWSGILEKIFGIGIANSAHTAGLVCGILISFLVSGIARLKANP